MAETIYNFSAGPATLPHEVMLKAQSEFVNFRGIGYGLIEASHRSPTFQRVIEAAEADIRELVGIPDDYAVLFLQGGASLQFAMVPMNIMVEGKPALYADTGSWTSKAIKEAKLLGKTTVVCSGKDSNYAEIPAVSQWQDMSADASYLYICSNNTIFGTEYHEVPAIEGVPLVADMSSNILSRPIDIRKFGIIFAGAQKNLGPAGVTLAIVKKELAERVGPDVPTMLKYTTHIEKDSMFNTPPVFGVYMVGLVAAWLKEVGGLEAIEKRNIAKSELLYNFIDESDFYVGAAKPCCRSRMNVTFRLRNTELEPVIVEQAAAAGLVGLKGHRSVGGLRASIYNAMPMAGVQKLVDFMAEFARNNG